MKTKAYHIIATILLFLTITYLSSAQISKELLGDWRFEAPNAPEGSTNGLVTISTDTVTMAFEGGLQFPSDWVKIKGDSIIYETTFDEDKVRFSLKVIDDQNLEGKAVWDEGETPVYYRRQKI